MTLLVSLDDAKLHLRITHDNADDDIEMKIAQASAIVLADEGVDAVPAAWLIGSPPAIEVPGDVKAKTLLLIGELYENREASTLNPNLAALNSVRPRKPIIA